MPTLTFDGHQYALEFHAARRPADHQMNIHAVREVSQDDLADQQVIVNVFGGSKYSQVEIRCGASSDWQPMKRYVGKAPYYQELIDREQSLSSQLPEAEKGTNLPWIPCRALMKRRIYGTPISPRI